MKGEMKKKKEEDPGKFFWLKKCIKASCIDRSFHHSDAQRTRALLILVKRVLSTMTVISGHLKVTKVKKAFVEVRCLGSAV